MALGPVDLFLSRFPGEYRGNRSIGLELEFPIVQESGEAPPYEVVNQFLCRLESAGFDPQRDEDTGEVVQARSRLRRSNQESFGFSRDVVDLELGYCTLEVSIAPEESLYAAEKQLARILNPVIQRLAQAGCRLLGYGVQPTTRPSRELVTPKGRYLHYEALSGHRLISKEIGADIHLFTVAAASQCHISVGQQEAIRAFNVLNGLAGVQLALTANSPFWRGREDQRWKAVRERMYDWAFRQNWPQPVPTTGVAPVFRSLEEYVDYLSRLRAVLVDRGGHSIRVTTDASVADFLSGNLVVSGRRLDGEIVDVAPEPHDLLYFAGFLEFNARLSPLYGTVESRVSCQQPPGEELVVPALVLGLIENLRESESLLGELMPGEPVLLRDAAARDALAAKVGGRSVAALAHRVIAVAEKGLKDRGRGEEEFLEPLRRRVSDRTSPADQVLSRVRNLGIVGLIESCTLH